MVPVDHADHNGNFVALDDWENRAPEAAWTELAMPVQPTGDIEGNGETFGNFRLIVDAVPVPAAVTTPDGELEALNRPALQHFGKSFEELKGWKSSDTVHPDDLPHVIAAQRSAHEMGVCIFHREPPPPR